MAEYEEVKRIFEEEVPLNMTADDEIRFYSAKTCHICEESLDHTDAENPPHSDHCHFTGG